MSNGLAKERATEVRCFRIDAECEVPACHGILRATGETHVHEPDKYQHECDACGLIRWFPQAYPRMRHEDV